MLFAIMPTLLQFLVSAPPVPLAAADAASFWTQLAAADPLDDDALRLPRHTPRDSPRYTIDRAAAGGFAADRLGYAFLAGYGAALQQLVGVEVPAPAALCATEEGGAHPRAMSTQLTPAASGWELTGRKTFVTYGPLVRTLLVVAKEGSDEQGRNRLALVRIPIDRPGIAIERQPDLPFVPEIPHAAIRFEKVQVAPDERLPGDGYERYLKPFRTIEDCHVMASALGFLVQVARRSGWPQGVIQELLMLIAAGRELAAASPLDAALHVALGGWLAAIERVIEGSAEHWGRVDAETAGRWVRDRPLLRIASKVRGQRLAAAWERLGAASRPSDATE